MEFLTLAALWHFIGVLFITVLYVVSALVAIAVVVLLGTLFFYFLKAAVGTTKEKE